MSLVIAVYVLGLNGRPHSRQNGHFFTQDHTWNICNHNSLISVQYVATVGIEGYNLQMNSDSIIGKKLLSLNSGI